MELVILEDTDLQTVHLNRLLEHPLLPHHLRSDFLPRDCDRDRDRDGGALLREYAAGRARSDCERWRHFYH